MRGQGRVKSASLGRWTMDEKRLNSIEERPLSPHSGREGEAASAKQSKISNLKFQIASLEVKPGGGDRLRGVAGTSPVTTKWVKT
jgi:hypothetical protein